MRPPPHPPDTVRRPALNPARKWFFRGTALLLLPVMVLGGLELALRLAGYGYNPNLFKSLQTGGHNFLVNNDDFSLRFFPPEMTRNPSAFRMPAQKSAGAFRIFILGESAAMGDPEPAYGAGRYLEVLLRDRFPGANFEVINLGITAINSHVILPIARDCAQQGGDLWILYMGNNEMVGPFGAATVFGVQSPPLAFVRLSLAIQQTRVGQLLMSVSRKLKRQASAAPSWGGMEMFVGNRVAPDDQRKEIVYRNFERNLRDIVQTGLDSGAKIILNTVSVNLKDSPPFASLADTNLPVTVRARFEQSYAEGCQAQDQGRFGEAALAFAQAAGLDPQMSEVQFRWGECLLRLTNFAAAREHLQRACDLDALPFRADSRINGAITQVGQQFAGPGLELFDAAAALAANTPAGVCGRETFYEHVHFNFDGSYRLARAWAEQVGRWLPSAIQSRAAGDWAAQETCDRRLGLSDWNRSLTFQSVLKRLHQPPLSSQSNNSQRLATLQAEVRDIRRRMTVAASTQARADFLEAIRRAPDDHYARESFAAFLESIGDLKQATAEWRRVLELLPHDYLTYFQLGRMLSLQSQWPEAQLHLARAVALHPALAEGWVELGVVRFSEGKYEPALADFDRARQLQPNDPRIHYERGRALSLLKRSEESVASFRQAIRSNPNYWEAHYGLGGELGMHNHISEAGKEFAEVVRLQPDFAAGHLNLGVALMKSGQLEAAEQQFEETLRLEPADKIASDYLRQLRTLKQRKP